MPAVNLDANEWGQVMAILSTAPWRDANPLLMKIGDQLRVQVSSPPPPLTPADTQRHDNATSLDGQGAQP